jgi:hypothetical protein
MGHYRSRIDGPVNRSAAAVGAQDTLLESDTGPCAFVAVAGLHALVRDVPPVPDVAGIALPVVAALLSAVVAAVGTDVVAVSVAESDLASVAAPAPAGFAGTGAQSVLVAAVGARVVPSGTAPILAASARAAAGLASAFALAASVPAERDVPAASALALISVACAQAAADLFAVAASHPLRAFVLSCTPCCPSAAKTSPGNARVPTTSAITIRSRISLFHVLLLNIRSHPLRTLSRGANLGAVILFRYIFLDGLASIIFQSWQKISAD